MTRRRLTRLLGTELPVLAFLAFAVLPWLWMVLSSFRSVRELTRSPIIVSVPSCRSAAALMPEDTLGMYSIWRGAGARS